MLYKAQSIGTYFKIMSTTCMHFIYYFNTFSNYFSYHITHEHLYKKLNTILTNHPIHIYYINHIELN